MTIKKGRCTTTADALPIMRLKHMPWNESHKPGTALSCRYCRLYHMAGAHMTSATGWMKILPSPISPVCDALTIIRHTVSTWVLRRAKACLDCLRSVQSRPGGACRKAIPKGTAGRPLAQVRAGVHLNTTMSMRALSTKVSEPCSVPL